MELWSGLDSLGHTALLMAAALLAGALNAVAGGGSFLTLPALVFTGVPPVVANATGTVALLPGYIASAWALKDVMAPPPGLRMGQTMVLSLLGGAAGAALLLGTPNTTFARVVPWLLLAATALFALGPQIRAWSMRQATTTVEATAGHAPPSTAPSTFKAALGMLAVALYGGYFNGGLGILCLALFGLLGQTQLHAMNGMKNLVSSLLTAIAVALYAAGGIVAWPQALVMMLAATVGGFAGAKLAQHIPATVLRWAIVATGLVMAGLFFAKG